MSKHLSKKFRWLSLIATWAVVCIHSRTDRWVVGVDDYATRIQSSIADIFYFAVPMFFMISGYMFVHSYEKYGWRNLLRQKVKSLYIPMIIWGFIGLICCLPIRLYAHHEVPTFLDVFKLPLMMFRSESVHFWYVRALIGCFVLAPIFCFISRRIVLVVLLMIGAILIPSDSKASMMHMPVIIIFFLSGILLSRLKDYNNMDCWKGILFIIFLVGLILSFIFKQYLTNHYFEVLFEPIFMIGFLWFGYDYVEAKFGICDFPKKFDVLFFVYCIHLIVLCWSGGLIRVIFGVGSLTKLIAYFLLCFTFWIDILIANLIKRFFPGVFLILSGGR